MYVITCNEKVATRHSGAYCRLLDMQANGDWSQCNWGKLRDATLFDSISKAEAIIKVAMYWAGNCEARVTQIHPMNLPCT